MSDNGNTFSQSDRLFTFDSPLGNSLLCNAFSGSEEISEIFHFNLELVSEDFNITWQQVLNKNVTVGIRLVDGSYRYFNGFIIRFEPTKQEGRLGYYNAEMVPWLWFLSQMQNCVVYQEKSVPEVIKTTFDNAGFAGQYDMSKLGDRHVPWINCCQYRESSFDFISRLAEIEGIYYYFKHELGKHTLIMVDHLSAHLPNPTQPTVKYAHDEGGGVLRGEDVITDSFLRKVVKPSKYAHKDYNFLIPNNPLYHEGDVHKEVAGSRELEIFDYPGEFEWPKDAPDWGTLRQEELEFDHAVFNGTGNVRALMPGYRNDIINNPRADLDGNYLIIAVTHHAHEGSFGAGFDSHAASYANGFEAIPSSIQFRPTRKTETPDVSSIQTATVVGPPGEEIYTDEYGRVKVQFHWDRTHPTDKSNCSCWIRVMQSWAGPNWGQIWIPRVGMEVMIQFLEGDPDRPVITGCLYNEDNRPPYKLPDHKNWSGVMSRSTKGGKMNDFNEIRFDDTMGSEYFLLHAQKDMQITVNNDTIESIKRDRTLNVKRNQIEQVEGDKHSTVKGNFNEKVGGNVSQTAGGYVAVNAKGDIVLKAGGNICITAGGTISLTAGNGISMNLGGGGGGLLGAAGGIAGGVGGMAGGVAGGVPGAAGGAPGGAPGGNPGAPGGIAGGVGGMAGGLAGGVGGAPGGAPGGNPGAPGGIAGGVGGMAGGLAGGVGGAPGGGPAGNPVAPGGIPGGVGGMAGAMAGGVPGAAGGAPGGGPAGNPVAPGGIPGGVGGMAGGVPGALGGAPGLPGGIPGLPGGIPTGIPGLPGGIPGMPGGIPGLPGTAPANPPPPADDDDDNDDSTDSEDDDSDGGSSADDGGDDSGDDSADDSGDDSGDDTGDDSPDAPDDADAPDTNLGGADIGNVPGGVGGGKSFISVTPQGIIIQGSPMIYLNCNMPAPSGTCNATPVVPNLPDLSNLAPDKNLGGAANPKVQALQNEVDNSSSTGPGDSMGGTASLAANPWVNQNSIDPDNEPDASEDNVTDDLDEEV